MARNSQAALVALNRFGFGARGGASGDIVNAASDPRGFVKAELSRPNGVLLEVPGLQSTPALADAVFAYQARGQARARDAAKSGRAESPRPTPAQPPPMPRRRRAISRSTASRWTWRAKTPRWRRRKRSGNANAMR